MSPAELVLQESLAITANGVSESQDIGQYTEGILLIDITAVSGTSPTLDIAVQTKINNTWVDIPDVTIAQQTAVNTLAVALINFGKDVRLSYTVGGTSPSFTLSSHLIVKRGL
jgi:hypothetical protein